MTKKRTSLDAVLGVADASAVVPSAVAAIPLPRPGRRPGVRQQTVYLPEQVYEQLRKLAFEERQRMHHYLLEGLNRVFRERGLPSVEELTGKPF